MVPHTAANDVYLHEARLPEWSEYVLAVGFSAAALGLLVAYCAGSRYVFPRATLRRIYQAELIGLTVIVLVIGFNAVLQDRSLLQLFTLGGGFGAIIQLGSVKMMVDLSHALRTDPQCQQ